jgi:hypothetical protein
MADATTDPGVLLAQLGFSQEDIRMLDSDLVRRNVTVANITFLTAAFYNAGFSSVEIANSLYLTISGQAKHDDILLIASEMQGIKSLATQLPESEAVIAVKGMFAARQQ